MSKVKNSSIVRLKIKNHDDEHISLEALEGIENFGFGTFLCNIKPEEIECDEFSKKAILDAKEIIGLSGLEIWEDNRIAWGSLSENVIMPISEISKHQGADKWLSQILT